VVSFIQTDDPDPDPPPSDEPCACGAAVTVSHVIYRLIHELPDERESLETRIEAAHDETTSIIRPDSDRSDREEPS